MPQTHSPQRHAGEGKVERGSIDPSLAVQVHDAIESLDEALGTIRNSGIPMKDFALQYRALADLPRMVAPAEKMQDLLLLLSTVQRRSPQLEAMWMMLQSVEALGPALSEIPAETSPQLARSLQATENAWRKMDHEFGLLSSLEVSERVGSRRPNRSYASDQHAKGRLIAVKRPGGLRYPGFQIDHREQQIRPVMEDLMRVARSAEISETSLALWMCSPTGYLEGARPVDRLDQPQGVVEAARQAFNVEW